MSSPRRRAVAAMALSGAISAALISTPAASAGIADGTAFPTQSATPHLPDSTSANWAGPTATIMLTTGSCWMPIPAACPVAKKRP